MALKYDIQNDNFDYYFLEQAAKMGENQRELLPRELLFKIFNKGYRINTKSSYKLSFEEKLFVLLKGLNKKWVLIIEDELNGMSEEEYFKFKKLLKKREYNESNAGQLNGTFVLGTSELVDTFYKLNSLSTSPAYNYLTKVRTKNYLQPEEYKRNMKFLAAWVSNYDSKRKKIIIEGGISVAEWIVLCHLYEGDEKNGSLIYLEKFKYSYNTSSTKIKEAFGTLQNKGFIIKYGKGKGTKLQITANGKAKINGIFEKYLVNCQ